MLCGEYDKMLATKIVITNMTREEKFQVIVEQIGPAATTFQPIHLSVLTLFGYMNTLFENGIIPENPVEIHESGQNALKICQEHEWQPSDTEIVSFCKDMVGENSITTMLLSLKSLRDDPETYLENARKQVKF
jgi:hypothetical protein